MKRIISALLVMVLCLGMLPAAAFAAENPFTDVAPGKYYYEPVLWAVEKGITTGTTTTTFSPDDPCTRKQIVTFLWRYMGQPEPKSMENPFTDVKADRFQKAILWAYYEQITTGKTATTFAPDDPCTRKQIVTFLWRAKGQPEPKSMENPFTDVKADRFQKAILWAYYAGITTGKTATTFQPDATCTRAQIVTFLYRSMMGSTPVTPPATEPTEPVTEPTEPVTEPTEPVTEPTEPATEPTEPEVTELSFKTQPQNAAVADGDTAVFTVEVVGGKAPYTYLWEYAKPTKWKFYPLTEAESVWAVGYNTVELSVQTDQLMISEQHRVRCVVTDAEGAMIISEYAEILPMPLTIQEGSPEDVQVNVGHAVNIFVYVKGGVPTEFGGYYYQWQYATKSNPEFKDITETDTWANGYQQWFLQVYVAKQHFDEGYQFRCVIKDAAGTEVISRAASLVKGPPVRFEVQPETTYTEAADTATFTVKAAGGGIPYTYQWEYLENETQQWIEMPGETGTSLTVTYAPEVTDSYRCKVTDAGGDTVISDVARIISPLKILSQPSNDPSDLGIEAVATVIVDGGDGELTFLWQYAVTAEDALKGYWQNATDLAWVTVDNADVTSRLHAVLEETDYVYRCVITRGDQSVTSRWVSFGGLRFGLQPESLTGVKVGDSVSLSTVGLGGVGELTYSWEISTDGSYYLPAALFNLIAEDAGNPKPFDGEDSHTLSFVVTQEILDLNFYFRCVIKDDSNTIESDAVQISQ